MKINQINNTNFKQTYMPNYKRYTDIQKGIVEDIETKMSTYEAKKEVSRPDILIARLGNKDSLYVFSCHKSYDYNTLSDSYENRLYVGKYDRNHPFNPEDIEKAQKYPRLNSFKAIALTVLATITASLGFAKKIHRI